MCKKSIAMLICVCSVLSAATIYITAHLVTPKQEQVESLPLEIAKEEQEGNTTTVLKEQEPLKVEYEPKTEKEEEVLMPDENEGVKIVVSDEIKAYTDENGTTLPTDPREDSEFKEEWGFEYEAVQYLVLPPVDATYCNTYTFYVDKSSVESGLLGFMEKYLERTVTQATEEFMDNSNGKYTYELKKLEPNEYPEDYPQSSSRDLVQLVFSTEIQ